MQRIATAFAAASLFVVAANAQNPCFESNLGVLAPMGGVPDGFGDDVMFDVMPLGFSLTLGAQSYDSCQFGDNGIIYLTQGGAATNGPTGAGNGYQNIDVFLGTTAGDNPRIAPLFMDFWSKVGTSDGIFVNDTVPGKFVVTWSNVVEWYATTIMPNPPTWTFQCQIFATGEIYFWYGANVTDSTYVGTQTPRVGVSQGDGVVDPGAVDLTLAGGNINPTQVAMYEEFTATVTPPPSFDMQLQSCQFTTAPTLVVQATTPCAPAYNETYGTGCYDISDSFYELMQPALVDVSGLKLTGTSLGGTPNTGYFLTVAPGAGFSAGAGATTLVMPDDGEVPAGTMGLYVGSNGFISTGAGNSTAFTPSVATLLDQPNAQVSSWTDLEPNNSGVVSYEETGTLATVTFDNVNGWGTALPNSFQMTYDTATGDFSIEWGTMSLGNPENLLVGYSPAGPSSNDGGLDISGIGAPVIVATSNVDAMTLAASGSPISTATSGSSVTFTTDNMYPLAPGAYIGVNIISAGSNPGLDLGIIGAPGCRAYIQTLDYMQPMIGATPSQSVNFPVPMGVPGGFEFYSQSACLVPVNGLPNGQNPFGMITSNGIKSVVNPF